MKSLIILKWIFDACLPLPRAGYMSASVLKSCQIQSELSLSYPCLCNVSDVTVTDLFLTMSPPVPGTDTSQPEEPDSV